MHPNLRCFYRSLASLAMLLALPAPHCPAQSLTPEAIRMRRLSAFDPRAMQLLDQVVAAYAHLSSLDQRTEFSSALMPLTNDTRAGTGSQGDDAGGKIGGRPDGSGPNAITSAAGKQDSEVRKLRRSLRLMVSQPNYLKLELLEEGETPDTPNRSQWISDGKTFWTYTNVNSEKRPQNTYTKEKTPSDLHGFLKLQNLNTGSLELMMLLGLNPFANLREQTDSAHYEGTETVRGIQTDVVTLKTATEYESTEARFYIGKEDFLLRRVVTETTPIAHDMSTPGMVGDEYDALVIGAPKPRTAQSSDSSSPLTAGGDTAPPESAPAPLMRSRISYDNIISPQSSISAKDFAFTIPPGTLIFEPFNTNGDTRRLYKVPTLKDMVRNLRSMQPKKQKQKSKSGKPVILNG